MQKKTSHIFNAGPSAVPQEVLESLENSLYNFKDMGMGILEISHRSWQFEEILNNSKTLLKELLKIPDSYEIFFCTGGATQQFSMIPMNLGKKDHEANYIVNGTWGDKAAKEAKKFTSTHIAGFRDFKKNPGLPTEIQLSKNPSYLHFTVNETVEGTQFKNEPDSKTIPLINDSSSEILGREIDISKYSLVYAGAQKNLGFAGVTIVMIKKDLISDQNKSLPILMDYNTYLQNNSLYNTAPVFAIYGVHETLHWIKKNGGVSGMEKRNREKAEMLYSTIDNSSIYKGIADKDSRSFMNVTFRVNNDEELEKKFIKEASTNKILGIKGHKLMGGLRASLYNAVSIEDVKTLCDFMKDFEKRL